MINFKLKYSIACFDKKGNVGSMSKNFGICSKGGEGYYKTIDSIVDSSGKLYILDKIKKEGKASFFLSLYSFQPMI